jgi:uncharacterized protein (TIGR03545 family)
MIKIPRILLKKYKIKAFNSKILKRLHIPKDKEMVKKLFVKNDSGKMEIIKDIPEEILVTLKPLAKSIKKNKGMVSRWKAYLVLFIVCSVLVFNLLFKDKLISRVVETGLESVFQADVNIKGLKFSILKGSISYSSLKIADSDNKIRNLLETGPSEFRISIAELTNKRIRIEEMSLTELKWDTLRVDNDKVEEMDIHEVENKDNGIDLSLEQLSINSDDIDFKAILDSQKENLISINLVDQSNEEIDTFTTKWNDIYSEKNLEIKELSSDIGYLNSLSSQKTKSVEDGLIITQKVKDLFPRVNNLEDDLNILQDDFINDKNNLIDLEKTITKAIDDDISYLTEILDISGGDMGTLVSDTAERYIRNRWNSYYEYGLKALKIYERLQNKEIKEAREETGIKRNVGRNIIFPSPEYPGFLIDHMQLSGEDSNFNIFNIEILTVTNEPDKLSGPLSFTAEWGKDNSNLVLNGILDMRSNSELAFSMEIESPEIPFSLEEGISILNINSFDSKAKINGLSVSKKDKDVILSNLNISLTDLDMKQRDSEGFIAETVKGIVSNMESIDLEAEIIIGWTGLEIVRVRSAMDNILSDKIGGYLDEKAEVMEDELRKGLTEYISSYLKENQLLQSSIESLGLESQDQISSVTEMGTTLNDTQNEVVNDADILISEKEAEAAKLKAEAEQKAEDEASKLLEQAKDKIKIPGF